MTIDIMLPCYGQIPLLRCAVHSVQDQDNPEWRLTIVDDAFPDGSTRAWCGGLDDERIRYIRNPVNLGHAGNFQNCLNFVEHDIAVFMGSDDMMLPNYVRTIQRLSQEYPQAAVIQPGVLVIDRAGWPAGTLVDRAKKLYAPRVDRPRLMGGEELAISILRGNWMYFPSLAFRSGPLRQVGFRGIPVVVDLAVVIDLLLEGHQVLLDPTLCFQYRRHRGSASSEMALSGARFVSERRYFLEISESLERRGWHRAAAVARRHWSSRLHALINVPHAVRNRQHRTAQALLAHAFGTAKGVPAAGHPEGQVSRRAQA